MTLDIGSASATLRIALVSEHASPLATLGTPDAGGQNVYVDALARGLARRGHQVVVYTRRDDAELPRQVPLGDGVVVEHVTAGPARHVDKDEMWPYMRRFGSTLRRRVAAWRPDVVHTHFWMSGFAGGIATRRSGIPWVHSFHALGVVKRRHLGDADPSPSARLAVERAIARNADVVLATCRDEVEELSAFCPEPTDICVVPCGIDTSVFSPTGPVAPRTPGRPRLVTVSRLVARKGIDDAIRALSRLPHAELVVAGGPPAAELAGEPEYHRLRGVAEAAGVGDRVRFLGGIPQGQVAALLRSADVAVCTPRYEPFGISPVEAMACGTPVIGTAVGGLLDTVVDGATGALVPPDRPDRIAAAARQLLEDPHRRRQLSVRAARRAAELYDWSSVVARIDALYRAVADSSLAATQDRYAS